MDLAIVDTRTGHVTAHFVDSADATGYARMLTWAVTRAPDARVWALEGTGNYAAGLAAFLADASEDVVEAGAGKRARGAKSDRIDAERPPAGPWRVSTRRRPASEGSARRCEWC